MFRGSMASVEIQARCTGTQHPPLHLTPSISPRLCCRRSTGKCTYFLAANRQMKAPCAEVVEAFCRCPRAFLPAVLISGQMCCLSIVGPGAWGRSLFVCRPIHQPLPLSSQLVPFEHLLSENCHQLDNNGIPFSKEPCWLKKEVSNTSEYCGGVNIQASWGWPWGGLTVWMSLWYAVWYLWMTQLKHWHYSLI